jgi:hypothetical protein
MNREQEHQALLNELAETPRELEHTLTRAKAMADGRKNRTAFFNFKKLAVLFTALLFISTSIAVYAYIEHTTRHDRISVSGTIIVSIPDDYPDPGVTREHGTYPFYRYDRLYWVRYEYTAEQADRILSAAKTRVFCPDGEPFPIVALHESTGTYRVNHPDHPLYDNNGEQIALIYWHSPRFEIQTLNDVLARRETHTVNTTRTHAEAVHLMGLDFSIPDFDGLAFHVNALTDNKIAMGFFLENPILLFFTVATERTPFEWHIPGATIWEYTVNDTPVYKITAPPLADFYTWEHGGLVYTLYANELENRGILGGRQLDIVAGMIK